MLLAMSVNLVAIPTVRRGAKSVSAGLTVAVAEFGFWWREKGYQCQVAED